MLTVVGIQRKHGVFQGTPFDNIMIHCLEDQPFTSDSSALIAGSVCESVKVRAADVRNVFAGLVATDSDLAALVGSSILVSYDRFGRPASITLVDSNVKGV